MSLQANNNLVYHICTDANFSFTDENLHSFVDANAAEHWLQVTPHRQVIYQKLVFGNVFEVISYVFKATQKCLEVQSIVFADLVVDFLNSTGITTRYYYEIPIEFWQWLQREPRFLLLCDQPVWAVADFEITRWQLYQYVNATHQSIVALDLPLTQVRFKFHDDVVIRSYDWPVHHFVTDAQLWHLQKREPHFLLLYRHSQTKLVEVAELNASSLAFVEFAQIHSTLSVTDLILEFTKRYNDSNLQATDILAFIQNILKLNIAMIVE